MFTHFLLKKIHKIYPSIFSRPVASGAVTRYIYYILKTIAVITLIPNIHVCTSGPEDYDNI